MSDEWCRESWEQDVLHKYGLYKDYETVEDLIASYRAFEGFEFVDHETYLAKKAISDRSRFAIKWTIGDKYLFMWSVTFDYVARWVE
jgi:hypothetical protein